MRLRITVLFYVVKFKNLDQLLCKDLSSFIEDTGKELLGVKSNETFEKKSGKLADDLQLFVCKKHQTQKTNSMDLQIYPKRQ